MIVLVTFIVRVIYNYGDSRQLPLRRHLYDDAIVSVGLCTPLRTPVDEGTDVRDPDLCWTRHEPGLVVVEVPVPVTPSHGRLYVRLSPSVCS